MVHLHGTDPWDQPGRVSPAGEARSRAFRPDRHEDRRGHRLHPPARGDAPRPEAVQRPDARGPAGGHRLRTSQGHHAAGRLADDPGRGDGGLARLHVPGTGRRLGHRPDHRHLLPGHPALRAHRLQEPLPRPSQPAPDSPERAGRRAGPVARAVPLAGQEPGSRGRQGHGQGAQRPVRLHGRLRPRPEGLALGCAGLGQAPGQARAAVALHPQEAQIRLGRSDPAGAGHRRLRLLPSAGTPLAHALGTVRRGEFQQSLPADLLRVLRSPGYPQRSAAPALGIVEGARRCPGRVEQGHLLRPLQTGLPRKHPGRVRGAGPGRHQPRLQRLPAGRDPSHLPALLPGAMGHAALRHRPQRQGLQVADPPAGPGGRPQL